MLLWATSDSRVPAGIVGVPATLTFCGQQAEALGGGQGVFAWCVPGMPALVELDCRQLVLYSYRVSCLHVWCSPCGAQIFATYSSLVLCAGAMCFLL